MEQFLVNQFKKTKVVVKKLTLKKIKELYLPFLKKH
jgi:hypothetical protein